MIIDVRSPSEFNKGHLPHASNIPLLSDFERSVVGTAYKEQGFSTAYKIAWGFVGPKVSGFLEIAEKLPQPLKIYCARGGMRSSSICWLFQQYGLEAEQMPGGYKSYRKAVLEQFEKPLNLIVLTGLTGSGKTERLKFLADSGAQTLDLEALAHHSGSAFGASGKQPTTEQFENEIFEKLSAYDLSKPLYIEDEGKRIGSCVLPHALWRQMQSASTEEVRCSEEERLERLMKAYAPQSESELQKRLEQIALLSKRLGDEKAKRAKSELIAGNIREAIRLILSYYDSAYQKSHNLRN